MNTALQDLRFSFRMLLRKPSLAPDLRAGTREIGIRLALGAQRSDILRMVLQEAMFVILVGVAVGVMMAVASGWLIS
jgi:ABC-type antimicrobial peptide transport system permease subunit